MADDFLSNLVQYGKGYMDRVGPEWAKDNAAFESSKPTVMDRVVRAVNPMTGFGSALGAMNDAAAQGLPPRDTAVALMQSLPSFGSVIAKVGSAASGAAKAIPAAVANDYLKTLGGFAASTAASVAADEAQAAGKPDYGNRPDGTKKGLGYFGELPLKGGGVATEYSMQSNAIKVKGKRVDFPTLVPTLTKDEVDMMTNDIIPNRKEIPESIIQKAIDHARKRIDVGQSPFAD